MVETAFACPKCKTVLEIEPGTSDLTAACPACQSLLTAHFFSAFFQPRTLGTSPSALVDQTEASCFYHPTKQAMRVCDGCGRLICSLCSIELGTKHLCPNCISSGKKRGKLTTLENSRTRYDSIALSLAVMGLFMSIFSVVLAPVAIYISLRYWNTPRSLVGGGHVRFILAISIAIFSLLLWGSIFGLSIFGASKIHSHHHA